MKKFLFLVVAALIGCMASAQIVQSTMVRKEKKQRKAVWIVRAGVSMNSFSGDNTARTYPGYNANVSSSFSSKTGYDVSFGYNLPIGKSGVYWGQELGMSTIGTGMKVGFNVEDTDEQKGYWLNTNINSTAHRVKIVPIQFGYKYAINDNIKLDIHVGAFASYNFAKSSKCDYEYGINGNTDVYKESSDYVNDRYENLVNDWDVGLHTGIGVWYEQFNLDICYQRGFNISEGDEYYKHYIDRNSISFYHGYKLKSQSIIVRLGVAF